MSASRFFMLCLLTISLSFSVMVGCQGSGSKNPSVPNLNLQLSKPTAQSGRSRVPDVRTNGHEMWGLWEISIDPKTMTADIVPLRGSEWHANVVEFMQSPYPASNLGLFVDSSASTPATGYFAVDVTLRIRSQASRSSGASTCGAVSLPMVLISASRIPPPFWPTGIPRRIRRDFSMRTGI